MNKTHLAQDEIFWGKLCEYWQAYECYKEMCDKEKLDRDRFPFCLCWPGHCKKAFFVGLAVLVVGVVALVLDLWRLPQGGISGRLDANFTTIFVVVVLVAAVSVWNCFFPDQYRSARQSCSNFLYFRSKNEEDLAKLEQVLSAVCEVVAPYREQRRLEEEARRRRYLECFRSLWAHLKGVLGPAVGDFDSERVDDEFSVLVPGEKSEDTEELVLVELKYNYDEEGLQDFISRIARVEAEQTRKSTQQRLRAEVEKVLAGNHS